MAFLVAKIAQQKSRLFGSTQHIPRIGYDTAVALVA